MKFFITGHKGFLGKKLQKVLRMKGHEVFVDDELDITKDSQGRMLPSLIFDAVIHCAAMADVDGCERDKYNAWKVNVDGTLNVLRECIDRGIKFVFISTDYVLVPNNVYAITKLVAEEEIQKRTKNYLIVRTSTLYGYNGKYRDGGHQRPNFVSWVLSQKGNIKTVTDNITCPTLIDDVAENIEKILGQKRNGLIHVAGEDCISKHEFANIIIKVFGLKIKNDKILSGQVKSWVAKRPFQVRLINSSGIQTHSVEEGLLIMKKQMEEASEKNA